VAHPTSSNVLPDALLPAASSTAALPFAASPPAASSSRRAAAGGVVRQHPSEGVRGGIERRNQFRFPMQHRAAATCPRVCEVASSGRSLPESVQGGVNRQQPARECARRRRAAESCSPVRGCASRRRAAAPGLRVCKAASSGDTLSEGVRGGVKRRHMVRGCSSGRRGDAPFEGVQGGVERRHPI